MDGSFSLLEPDATVIRAHLERLFRRARIEYPDGMCEIAWSDGRGQVTSANTFPVTEAGLNEATACAVRHNNEHRNVYVGVNPRKPGTPPWGRGSAEDVEIAFFNFADVDNADGATKLRMASLPYTFAVTTGKIPNHRPHAYWELDEPTRNLKAWSWQQRALADSFDGDAVIDPPRIMRLAGTVNYPSQKKVDKGYRVELVTLQTLYDDEERDPVTVEALFSSYPYTVHETYDPENGEVFEEASPGQEAPRQDGSSGPDFGTRRFDYAACVSSIRNGQNLHNNSLSLIAHLVQTGHRDWLITELLQGLLNPVSDGGTLGQIPEMIRSARSKWSTPDRDDEEDFSAYTASGQAEKMKQSLHLLSLDNWLTRELSEPVRFLGDFIDNSTRAEIIGPTGLGKTNFGMAVAFAIADGAPFLHWKGSGRPCRVLYIDGEMSRRLMKKRLQDALRRHGGKPATIHLLSREDFPDMAPLNTQEGQRFIDQFIEQLGGVDLVIFDNIQALLVGDMKDEEPWQQTLPWVRSLTARSIGQVWFHHTGHNETHGYGTKTREWQLDTVALMEAVERPDVDLAFRIKFTKARSRTPDNRGDFTDAVITLVDDEWHSEQVAGGKKPIARYRMLELLIDELARHGTIPPANERIPPYTSCVTEEAWRRACASGCISEGAAEAQDRAFRRGAKKLIEAGKVGKCESLVWVVRT